MIWDRILPRDTRGWLSLGIFILMTYVLSLIAFVPDLDKSQLFTAIASGIVGSGFGSVVGYHFATTKTSSDNSKLAQSAMDMAQNAPVLVEPPATATVEVKDNVRSK